MGKTFELCYKKTADTSLCLDLFLPDGTLTPPPLVMWIHGGGWIEGDRKTPLLEWLVPHGFALASIDYRLTGQGTFPNHIIDCKDALIFLKENAAQYGYDPKRIIVAGDSAGGHLAALMGTSAGHTDWEPAGADCSVQAVIDFYGPTVFGREWPNSTKPDSCESQLIGAPVASAQGRARTAAASPLTYIDGSEPPFLIFHGDADDVVPYAQSVYLRDALEKVGVPVSLHRVWGAGHGFSHLALQPEIMHFLFSNAPPLDVREGIIQSTMHMTHNDSFRRHDAVCSL